MFYVIYSKAPIWRNGKIIVVIFGTKVHKQSLYVHVEASIYVFNQRSFEQIKKMFVYQI